ncbi:hypothetical protein B0J14DRAFT_608686 [Halenospora varia]|nr:hypothetical protein B0J14DRAFT_608686 [Halenospora varia]
MASTTIQIIILSSNSTFDQPTTPAGKQWRKALDFLIACPGWSTIAWGRHHESPDQVTILTGWAGDVIPTFLSTHYSTFATLLEPLLAAPPDPPDATNLSGLVGPVFGKVMTTISKLTFRNLDEGERMIVGWACRQYPPELRLHAKREAEINGKARWNTGFSYDAKWAIDPSTGERLDTMWIISSYDDLETEEQVSKRTFLREGVLYGKNIKGILFQRVGPLLEREGAGELVYHLSWEIIT